jgi:hypothetical protein
MPAHNAPVRPCIQMLRYLEQGVQLDWLLAHPETVVVKEAGEAPRSPARKRVRKVGFHFRPRCG